MLRNDVSYSSITPHRRTNNCLCCFCSCHCSLRSFCKNCLLRLPYGTLISTFLAGCGLIISIVSILHSTNIADRMTHDLLKRKYYWLSDLKVWYIVFGIFVSVIIVINLVIGFATSGQNSATKRNNPPCRTCGCSRASTTTFIIKSVFVINYILFYFLIVLGLVVLITLFICYVLSSLCNDGTRVMVDRNPEPLPTDLRMGQSSQYIDLRQFSPLLALRSNETQFLYIKDDRLKKLCGDYVSALIFYILLCSIGMALLCSGFVNYLINLSVNWARMSTKQKYAEIMYLNGAEMTAFGGDGDAGTDSRY